MNARPLYDRLLVRRVPSEGTTKSGLHIPDSAKKAPQEGVIVAVGSGKILEDGSVRALDVSIGDRILFGEYSGAEMEVEGEELLILREDEVLAVVE